MSKIDNGGPAFPVHFQNTALVPIDGFGGEEIEPGCQVQYRGMSLMDHFAGQAVIGLMLNAKRNPISDEEIEWLANTSFRVADAMIRVRKAGAE